MREDKVVNCTLIRRLLSGLLTHAISKANTLVFIVALTVGLSASSGVDHIRPEYMSSSEVKRTASVLPNASSALFVPNAESFDYGNAFTVKAKELFLSGVILEGIVSVSTLAGPQAAIALISKSVKINKPMISFPNERMNGRFTLICPSAEFTGKRVRTLVRKLSALVVLGGIQVRISIDTTTPLDRIRAQLTLPEIPIPDKLINIVKLKDVELTVLRLESEGGAVPQCVIALA